MTRLVTVAALQLPAWTEGETAGERKAFHVTQIQYWLREAGRARADVACLGETARRFSPKPHAIASNAKIPNADCS